MYCDVHDCCSSRFTSSSKYEQHFSSCFQLAEVRRGVAEAVRRLRREVAGIRLGVVAHGDYCDARTSYVTKLQDFTCDEDTLCRCWAAHCRASNESS